MSGKEFMPKVYRLDVVVDFTEPGDPTWGFHTGAVETDTITIDAYLSILYLYLEPRGVPDPDKVVFASHVQWKDSAGMPAANPSCLAVQRQNDHVISIVDVNGEISHLDEEKAFSFFVSVLYESRMYSSPDPTIINREPPP